MDLYLCDGKEILRQEIQTRGAAIQIPVKEGNEVSYLQVMRAETFATRKTGFSSSQTQIDIFFFNPANFDAAAELLLPLQGRFSIACFRQTSKPSGSGAAEAYTLREKGSGTAPGSACPLLAPSPHLRRRSRAWPGPLRSAPPGRPLRGCHGYDRAAGPSRRRPPLGCPRQSPAERGGRPARTCAPGGNDGEAEAPGQRLAAGLAGAAERGGDKPRGVRRAPRTATAMAAGRRAEAPLRAWLAALLCALRKCRPRALLRRGRC